MTIISVEESEGAQTTQLENKWELSSRLSSYIFESLHYSEASLKSNKEFMLPHLIKLNDPLNNKTDAAAVLPVMLFWSPNLRLYS